MRRTNRASDRRNLSSEPSKQVLRIWESFVARKLGKKAKEVERFIQSMMYNHRMCGGKNIVPAPTKDAL